MNLSANRIILFSGVVCSLLGVYTLIGWYIGSVKMLTLIPGDVTIKFNSGLGFLLCGLSCLLVAYRRLWPARLTGGGAALIGGITLLEHLCRTANGIDQLFFRDHLSVENRFPGRMASNSAFCFLMSGLALIILAWGRRGYRRPFVSVIFGAWIFSLGSSSVAQYIFGVTTPSSGNGLVQMAVASAAGFVILGMGLLHASWKSWSPDASGAFADGNFLPPVLTRPWAPIAMSCIAAALSLLVWGRLVVKQDTEITRSTEIEATKTQEVIQAEIESRALALARLSRQWDIYGTPTEAQWQAETSLVIHDLPGWRAIAVHDTTGHVKWVCPNGPNHKVIGYGAFADPLRRRMFEASLQRNAVAGSVQIETMLGGRGFFLAVPIRQHGALVGYLTGGFLSNDILAAMVPEEVTRGFAIAVDEGGQIFWSRTTQPGGVPTNVPVQQEPYLVPRLMAWDQVRPISDYGLNWRLHVHPTALLLEQEQSSIPGLALGLGLLFAGMVGATVHFAQTARIHSLVVNDVNMALEREIGERKEYMRQVEIERENALKGWAEAERQSGLLTNQTLELKRSNESLTEFASIASHDLKEPLRKIQTFGDMLRRRAASALDKDALGYLDRMTGAAQRMQTLIDGLLAYSRASTRPPELVRVDLNDVVRGVCSDLEARLGDSGGRVECGALPVICADPVQMRQLFQNLIGNALKFRRPDVGPIVKVTSVANGGFVRIVISDNGIGFDPKFSDRIFRIFERLEATSRFEGTGIGLAICRTIVDRHNGTILASAALDKGATFTIDLPALPEAAAGTEA